ncbi:hypothetical protein [Kitasatospora sp. NRRL B-11411]|uniref:hypothetical protein n=1 Tax=Kitasatospora sp. NRRL B-11411 TaxID=1463822 RepID=UPI0004C429BB|nr:hypothetical protein [Kitasatospora sp. NRRL B-11411]
MKSTIGRSSMAAIAGIAALAAVLVVPGQAQAANAVDYYVSDNCNTQSSSDCSAGFNVLDVYYSQNGEGGRAKFLGNVSNYDSDSFYEGAVLYTYHYRYAYGTSSAGVNQGVRNNAASVKGCSSAANYRVYYSPAYQGSSQYIPGDWGCDNVTNLESWLRNENASQHWS